MTRRERLEQKLSKREDWAEKAKARSEASFSSAAERAAVIPFGQPILIGHYSEKRDRRYREGISRSMERGCEQAKLASHHSAKADGIARQLDSSIFSDDAGAIAALEARIAVHEEEATRINEINRAWRKTKGAGSDAERVAALVVTGVVSEAVAKTMAETMRLCPYLKAPLDATLTRAAIRRDRERIEEVRVRQTRQAAAEESTGGVSIVTSGDWCSVTFAEKPDRAVLDVLKAARFRWGQGSWHGRYSDLPAGIEVPAVTAECNEKENEE